jgi:hypothetical protein
MAAGFPKRPLFSYRAGRIGRSIHCNRLMCRRLRAVAFAASAEHVLFCPYGLRCPHSERKLFSDSILRHVHSSQWRFLSWFFSSLGWNVPMPE